MLPEEAGAAEVRSPHVVDGHGGVELVQQLPEHVLAPLVLVDGLGQHLQQPEQDLLGRAGKLH